MKNMAMLIMIILCAALSGSPGFAGSRHDGGSGNQDNRWTKGNERTLKHEGQPVKSSQRSFKHDRNFTSSKHMVRQNDRPAKTIQRSFEQDRNFTSSNRMVRRDDRPRESSQRSFKHNDHVFESSKPSIKFDDRSAASSKRMAKSNGPRGKHDEHSNKHDDHSSKHHDDCTVDQRHRSPHHRNHSDKHYDYRSHDDEWLAIGVGFFAGAVGCASRSPVVVAPSRTVIVQESVIIEQPSYVSTYAIETIIVTASLLNVRSGPGGDFAVISLVYQGDRLVVYGYGVSSEWLYVELPSGEFGWVLAEYTVPVTPFECG